MPEPSSRLPLPSLGPRGEGWLVLQVLVIVAMGAAGILGPPWAASATPWRQLGAGAGGLLGAALAGAGVLGLGRQLTPLPRPVEGGELRDRGAYALVRHPMYGGVLLMALAWALATSPLALLPVAAGAGFLEAKRRLEEAWLVERHPEYQEYRHRVRWRMIPFLW